MTEPRWSSASPSARCRLARVPGSAGSRAIPALAHVSAASPLARSARAAARKARGRLGGGQVPVGAQGVPRDADGQAGVGVGVVADPLGQRAERAPVQDAAQRGVGVEPGDHLVAVAAVREPDARRGVDPRQAAGAPLLAVGLRIGQVEHPGDERGVDGQVSGGDRGGRQPSRRDLRAPRRPRRPAGRGSAPARRPSPARSAAPPLRSARWPSSCRSQLPIACSGSGPSSSRTVSARAAATASAQRAVLAAVVAGRGARCQRGRRAGRQATGRAVPGRAR